MPNFSAVEGLKIVLYVFAILGTVRLFALAHPNSTLSQALLTLY